jgi:hypothetical protein
MNNSEIAQFLRDLTSFVDTTLIPVIFAFAFIVFLWGVFQYFILGGANNEQRETGRKFVLWAVIAFVVMLSFWGIINLIQRSLGFDSTGRPCLPTFNSNTRDCLGGSTAPDAGNTFYGICENDGDCDSGFSCGANKLCVPN